MGWRKSCIFSYSPIFTSPDFHFGKSPPSFNPGSYTRLDEIRNKQDSPAGRFFISTNHGETLGFDHLPSPGARGNAGYTPDYAPAPPLTQLSQTLHHNQMLTLERCQSDIWKSHSVGFGNAEQQRYCLTLHLSLKNSQATLGDSGVLNLLEKTSHSYSDPRCCSHWLLPANESQQDIADKVSYVEECRRCNFYFRVEATQRELKHE